MRAKYVNGATFAARGAPGAVAHGERAQPGLDVGHYEAGHDGEGIFLQAYVIIDLFSHFVVGWMLATKQCKHLAATLFAETIARHNIQPGLIVHADRGSAMKSDTVAQLLAELGAARSFSRTTRLARRSSRR